MVPQSREIHRRFYDGDTNLTPHQTVKCLLALDVSTLNLVSFLPFLSSSVDRYSLTGLNQTLKKKRGNVYQSWRNPRLTRLWNNERIQKQWTWTPPPAQKCRWKGNLKSRRIKQKSAKVNQIIYCSFEFQDQFRATSFLHYVLKSSTSYCGRFMGNEACQKKTS